MVKHSGATILPTLKQILCMAPSINRVHTLQDCIINAIRQGWPDSTEVDVAMHLQHALKEAQAPLQELGMLTACCENVFMGLDKECFTVGMWMKMFCNAPPLYMGLLLGMLGALVGQTVWNVGDSSKSPGD